MTVQAFADQLSIALAKRGARVRVQHSNYSSIYLVAKYRGAVHSIRISDHPPGKRWRSGPGTTSITVPSKPSPKLVAEFVFGKLKNGL